MYTLSLELVNECNLNCSYCYLGKKKNRRISRDNICRAIELAMDEAVKQYDKTLVVYFIGGEPLLAFDMIKFAVNFCEENSRSLIIKYSLTTNGILINQEITDYFIDKNFEIKLSIDGDKKVHDKNRKSYNGDGSFDVVISKLKYIKQYEMKTGKLCHISQVITTNNYLEIVNGIEKFRELGFTFIESGIDKYACWGEHDIQALEKELEQAFEYYKVLKMQGEKIYWHFWESYIQNYFSERDICFFACHAGLVSCFVNADGIIYPCKEVKGMEIGDVFSGLDIEKIRAINRIAVTENAKCLQCEYLKKCKTQGCLIDNFGFNGNFYDVTEISCQVTKFIYALMEHKLSSEQKLAFCSFYH